MRAFFSYALVRMNSFPVILAGNFFRLPFWQENSSDPRRRPLHPSYACCKQCKETPEVAEILDVRFLTRSLNFSISSYIA